MKGRRKLTGRHFIRKLLIGAFPLLLILFMSCAGFNLVPFHSRPFVQYVVKMDEDDGVIDISGTLYGSGQKRTEFRQFLGLDTHDIRPFEFSARTIDGSTIEVLSKPYGFEVVNGGEDFTFSYKVAVIVEDMYSPDIRTMLSMISDDHWRLLAKDIILVPDGGINEGVIIDFRMKTGWRFASTSPSIRSRAIINGLDELKLSSFISGDFDVATEDIGGVELVVVSVGNWNFKKEDFEDAVRRIFSYEIYLFGSAPRDKYLVVCEKNPVKGGKGFDYYGIHLGGAIFLFLDPKMDASMLFDVPMSIVSHELFHSWNGEALKPRSNEFLWFIEGATVYYSYQVLVNTGIITIDQYRARRRSILENFYNNPYYDKIPVRGACNDDLNDKNAVRYLYDGGYLVCEAIDKLIRNASSDQIGLIDVLKYIYEGQGESGYIDREILLNAIEKLTGHDLSTQLSALVDSTSVEFSSSLSYSLD